MKIKSTYTVTTEVEVLLPYYSKTSCHFYKVLSEGNSIQIHEGSASCSIEKRFHTASCFDCDPSNEQEFNEAFERISKRLRDESFPEIKTVNQSK